MMSWMRRFLCALVGHVDRTYTDIPGHWYCARCIDDFESAKRAKERP